jgi:hypothetical protein
MFLEVCRHASKGPETDLRPGLRNEHITCKKSPGGNPSFYAIGHYTAMGDNSTRLPVN